MTKLVRRRIDFYTALSKCIVEFSDKFLKLCDWTDAALTIRKGTDPSAQPSQPRQQWPGIHVIGRLRRFLFQGERYL